MNNSNLKKILKNKLFLIIAVSILLIILFIIFSLSPTKDKTSPVSKTNTEENNFQSRTQDNFQNNQRTVQIKTRPPVKDLKSAIDEAKQSANEYTNWQEQLKIDYPWLRRLPLASEKYYVYFNLSKRMFLARLYPKRGDNVEKMKADIVRQLKEVKQIPIENFQIDWTIMPQ